jgi:hypothetical protein
MKFLFGIKICNKFIFSSFQNNAFNLVLFMKLVLSLIFYNDHFLDLPHPNPSPLGEGQACPSTQNSPSPLGEGGRGMRQKDLEAMNITYRPTI